MCCFCYSSFSGSKHSHRQINSGWYHIIATPSSVLIVSLASHSPEPHCTKVFCFHSLHDLAMMWFSPRVPKSCSRSSSRPSTGLCSPLRPSSGQTDIWRTNIPMSGRATGSWAQGVCLSCTAEKSNSAV